MTLERLYLPCSLGIPAGHENDYIDAISYDSRMCGPGSLFVALRGEVTDGHVFAADAYSRGCRAFLAERPLSLPDDAAVTICHNTREALASVSAVFYDRPADSLHIIGVTGTKGKTTTCLLISSILNDAGIPTGSIGSFGVMIRNTRTSTLRMVPEPSDLNMYFRKMLLAGIKTVVMEVPSQSVLMERLSGVSFYACVFTNLFPAHIGAHEHKSFDDYRDCKARVFSDFNCGFVAYNADDPNAGHMLRHTSALSSSVSTKGLCADYCAFDISTWREGGALGVSFTLRAFGDDYPVRLSVPGEHAVSNALLAASVCHHFGVSIENIIKSLSHAAPLGHLEVVASHNGAAFVIDYAYDEPALRRTIRTLREYCRGRLIVLVGCAGGRAFSRRASVGGVISELSDLCILTSYDPDFEDPMSIIHDILDGFGDRETPFVCIPDRREAVEYAVREAKDGDVVLFAGKGHENYILIEGEYIPFSERLIIRDTVDKLLMESR